MKRREYGSSLLEILVVIVVFGVGILGIVQIFPKALSILKSSREGAIAESLAQQKLHQIKFQKWQWSETPYDQCRKGFSYDKLRSKKFDPTHWRDYLTPQTQNQLTEHLTPNKNGLIFCTAGPIGGEATLSIQGENYQNEKIEKVEESEFSDNSLKMSFCEANTKETKGLGIYRVSSDLLKKVITVQYRVKDWRIISEDFLGIRNSSYLLSGQNIKKRGELEADNNKYSGFLNGKDFILVDLLNGNIINRGKYILDYRKGSIHLGHSFGQEQPIRAYYQKKGEWYLQVLREQDNSPTQILRQKWIVRVYWNPYYFRLQKDPESNVNTVNKWTEQYKMIELEAF